MFNLVNDYVLAIVPAVRIGVSDEVAFEFKPVVSVSVGYGEPVALEVCDMIWTGVFSIVLEVKG